MRSWLISALALKTQQGGAEALKRLCPHDWLVWEPGQWRPARANVETVMGLPQITSQTVAPPEEPKEVESLVIALEPNREHAEVTFGRAGCDLVLDDRTLSSHHLSFTFDDHHWWVHDVGSRNGSLVDGRKLGKEPVCLTAGMRLQPAQVVLTYYTQDTMYARLKSRRG
ncbi:MAG: FHA domain-containing protein [Archangiaceae bacterium]|nr:FHA domain-containing protein [Archangiaceae bacterium]